MNQANDSSDINDKKNVFSGTKNSVGNIYEHH